MEKCLGSKINEDFTEFFDQIKILMSENKYEEAKDALLEFISTNPKETMAINQYLDCLIELKQFEEVDTFIQSLEKDVRDTEEIKQIIKKMEIIKKNESGPSIEELIDKLNKNPNDIDLIIEVADKYFSIQNYENSLDLLLKNYPKNREKIKNKMVEFFGVLGNSDEYTIKYRKKLSQVMFS